MFRDIVATGEAAWTHSAGMPPSEMLKGSSGSSGGLEFKVDWCKMIQYLLVRATNRNWSIHIIRERSDPMNLEPHWIKEEEEKLGGAAKLDRYQIVYAKLDCIVDAVEIRASNSLREPGSGIRDVMEDSDLYFAASHIFKKRANREMFVVMTSPEFQFRWLKEEVKLLQQC